MDIIYTGGKYKVYNTGVTTYNTLPIGTYYIEFNQLEGFSLIPSANVAIESHAWFQACRHTQRK